MVSSDGSSQKHSRTSPPSSVRIGLFVKPLWAGTSMKEVFNTSVVSLSSCINLVHHMCTWSVTNVKAGRFASMLGALSGLVRCTNMCSSLSVARFYIDVDTSWLCAFTVWRPTACTTEVCSQMFSASCARGCCPRACEAQSHASDRMLPVLRYI